MNRQAGYSLVEIAIGMAALGMIALFSFAPVIEFTKATKIAKLSHESRLSNSISVNLARSAKLARTVLNREISSDIKFCLQRRGTNCQSHAGESRQLDIAAIQMKRFFGPEAECDTHSIQCPLERLFTYRWLCPSANECSGAELTLTIEGDESTSKVKTYTSKAIVPASTLVSQQTLDFSLCRDSGIAGVDYLNGKVICMNASSTPEVECGGFSVIGMGSGSCGEPGTRMATAACAIRLNATQVNTGTGPSVTGVSINYMGTGSSMRLDYDCHDTLTGSPIKSDLAYYTPGTTFTADSDLYPSGWSSKKINIVCSGRVRGEVKEEVLGTCEASLEIDLETVLDPDSGGTELAGSGSSSSSSSSMTSSSVGGPSSLCVHASGTGASLSTADGC